MLPGKMLHREERMCGCLLVTRRNVISFLEPVVSLLQVVLNNMHKEYTTITTREKVACIEKMRMCACLSVNKAKCH